MIAFFIVADLHTLTTRPAKASLAGLPDNIRQMVLDYLAVGIDPQRSVIFLQSAVPETYELNLLLEMLVSVPRLERLPSLKEMARDANLQSMPFGVLGYPVLRAADILLPRSNLVPVGKDNEAHVEIARQFNALYGEVFPIPEALIGDVPTLIGTDGQAKMSKSLGNAIYLSDSSEMVEAKVQGMFTDPRRLRADIPGRVEGNPVFIYHRAFNPDTEEVEALERRYREGKIGDVEVKAWLTRALNAMPEPIRDKRAEFAARIGLVEEILASGTCIMRNESVVTMELVHQAMGCIGYFRKSHPPGTTGTGV
jgi:tryptophanyl-tRNA synthetase